MRFLAGLLAIAIASLFAADISDGKFDLNIGTLAFAILLIASVVTIVRHDAIPSAVAGASEIDFFGLSFKSAQTVGAAESFLYSDKKFDSDEVKGDELELTGDVRNDFALISKELASSLRKVRDRVLQDPANLGEVVVIARLADLELLPDNERRLAEFFIEAERIAEVIKWPKRSQKEMIAAGARLENRFVSRVFDRFARRTLQECGFQVADFKQTPRHRPDVVVLFEGSIARATFRPQPNVEKTIARMEKLDGETSGGVDSARSIKPHLIVIPDGAKAKRKVAVSESLFVLKLSELATNPSTYLRPVSRSS